jgi:hypothetical protein
MQVVLVLLVLPVIQAVLLDHFQEEPALVLGMVMPVLNQRMQQPQVPHLALLRLLLHIQ